MTDSIIILGSTGSIGTQALEVCSHLGISVRALAAGHQIDRLAQQIRCWHPTLVSVADAEGADQLAVRLADILAHFELCTGGKGCLRPQPVPAPTWFWRQWSAWPALSRSCTQSEPVKTLPWPTKKRWLPAVRWLCPFCKNTAEIFIPLTVSIRRSGNAWQVLPPQVSGEFS